MATHSGIKLAVVRPYLDNSQAAAIVAEHYGEPVTMAQVQIALAQQAETNAGF
jgi:hypothetical protein